MVGVEGFEPSRHGTKTHCLTTWLHPSKETKIINLIVSAKLDYTNST